jgi:hypothetical protein
MLTHAQLIDRIERHLDETGESATAFGRRIANDGNLLSDLRAGRSPRLRLVEAIVRATDHAAAFSGEANHDAAREVAR